MAKSQTLDLKIQCNTLLYMYIYIFSKFKISPFSSIWSEISIAKDLIENVLVLKEGGSTPVSPTLLVIRVVLLHTEWFVQSFNSSTVHACLYFLINTDITQRKVLWKQILYKYVTVNFTHLAVHWLFTKTFL